MSGTILRKIRTKLFTKICLRTVQKYGNNIHINHWCKFTNNTSIGDNCHFNGMKITGKGNVLIGDNFHSGGGILILTSNHNYDFGNAIPYDNTTIDGDVKIEDNVWIGQNVMILSGVKIGEGAIIQAGSVVVSDVEACTIVGGHPARAFKKRDERHYKELKKQKKFF
ncbi:MAG: acyltransferase [Clostridiales bacterium]|nr:acyltransferase [Clostridiales bacterium]